MYKAPEPVRNGYEVPAIADIRKHGRFTVSKELAEAGWEPVGDPVGGTQRWEPSDRGEEKEG